MSAVLTVLLGTDHHPFDRLVRWADAWQRAHPEDRVTVQHGSSEPPREARGVELVPPDDLSRLLAGSDVVITHGGPGTIMGARQAGHHPFAMPRDPRYGEHVDEHQVRFVAWAEGKGLCTVALHGEDLDRQVTAALQGDGTRTGVPAASDVSTAVGWLDASVTSRRHRRSSGPAALPVLLVAGGSATAVPSGAGFADAGTGLVVGDLPGLWRHDSATWCSCGCPARECPFWAEVTRRAFAGWDPERRTRLGTVHARLRGAWPRAVRRHQGTRLRTELLELANGYRRAGSAATQVSGTSWIAHLGASTIDAVLLSHCRELDLRVVRAPDRRLSELGRLDSPALRYRGVPVLPDVPRVPVDAAPDWSSDHVLTTERGTPRGTMAP